MPALAVGNDLAGMSELRSGAAVFRTRSDGRISDRTNLTRAKDALSRFVESEARRLRGAADTIRKPSVRPADASSYEGVAS